MKKYALFVFNGDPVCFIHVLLNALDLNEKGHGAGIVVEGSATGLIPELAEENHPLHKLWTRVREKGFVLGVCRACSRKMGTLEDAEKQGLSLLEDMSGHPGMAAYIEKGYEVITF
ncbi:MAG: DsrE family protein [Desulfonatronovibrionaceae bacterium]